MEMDQQLLSPNNDLLIEMLLVERVSNNLKSHVLFVF